MVLMCKNNLRTLCLKKRDELDPHYRELWDDLIYQKFIKSTHYATSKVIFIFSSFRSEVDTHRIIIKAVQDGKVVGVPRVISKTEGMKVYRISCIEDLEPGYYGVLEPRHCCQEIQKEEIDLIVMPGAAFDTNGGRIGYGGGFYDKYLVGVPDRTIKLALAYSSQILDHVPMDENDMRVDLLITN